MEHSNPPDTTHTPSQANGHIASTKETSAPSKAVTKNSSAPLPTRTFPSVLRAMTALKDGMTSQNKIKPVEELLAEPKMASSFYMNGDSNTTPTSDSKSDSDQSINGIPQNGRTGNKLSDFLQFKSAPSKKVAVIYPHRIATRSPSPRPKSHLDMCQCDNSSKPQNGFTEAINPAPAASPKSSMLDSKFRRLWSKPTMPVTNGEIKNNERIVPIKIVSTRASFDDGWSNGRPPTPATFRRLSVSTASLPRSVAAASASRVRNIPVVRTGVVMKNVEILENLNSSK